MIAGALDVVSSWSIEDGRVVVVSAWRGELVRHAALRHAILVLGSRTHCKLSAERSSRGVIHWSAFRVLERWGYAMRAISDYVALTPVGRAAFERCQTFMRASPSMEVPPTA